MRSRSSDVRCCAIAGTPFPRESFATHPIGNSQQWHFLHHFPSRIARSSIAFEFGNRPDLVAQIMDDAGSHRVVVVTTLDADSTPQIMARIGVFTSAVNEFLESMHPISSPIS